MPLRDSRLRQHKLQRIAEWQERRAEIEAKTGVAVDVLATLQHQLAGTVVVAGDPEYNTARQLAGPTFQGFPVAVVECKTANDVRLALAAAQHAGWPIACRSGGHSTAGFSVNDGMVIGLSGLSYARVDPATGVVTVGAGTTFDVLMSALDGYGLHLVGGGCGDVCIGGYLQGGGYGFSSLRFGMHCDIVRSMTVILADGSEVVASSDENPDLFWAMRGGTGNNFGVLVEAEYLAVPLGTLAGFVISWPVAQAAAALVQLQSQFTGPGVPGALLGYMGMLAYQNGTPVLTIAGIVDGSQAEATAMIAPLTSSPGAHLVTMTEGRYKDLDNSLLSAICPAPLPKPGFSEEKQTGYVGRVLSAPEWQALIDHFQKTPCPSNVMMIEPYGGAIVAVAPEKTAFVHRRASMDLVFEAIWDDEADRAPAIAWLDVVRDRFADLVTGHVYQNYPRRGLDDYQWRYWGENFDTLLWIKQKYDPANVFHFEQSVAPRPPGHDTPASARVRFSDPAIIYRYRPAGDPPVASGFRLRQGSGGPP